MEQAEWIEVFKAPKFARLPTFIKDECWKRGLRVDMEVTKGWIRESVRIKVSGDKTKVHDFRSAMYYALESFNSEDKEP